MSSALTPLQKREKKALEALKNNGQPLKSWQHTKRNKNGKWYTKHWMDELTFFNKWEDYDAGADRWKQRLDAELEEKKRKLDVALEDVRESKAQMPKDISDAPAPARRRGMTLGSGYRRRKRKVNMMLGGGMIVVRPSQHGGMMPAPKTIRVRLPSPAMPQPQITLIKTSQSGQGFFVSLEPRRNKFL